jgi:hypothetical protein
MTSKKKKRQRTRKKPGRGLGLDKKKKAEFGTFLFDLSTDHAGIRKLNRRYLSNSC